MRAIKFRVFIHPHCGGGIPQECYNTVDYSDNYGGDLEEFFGLYKPHFFEIMQFTGLTDKNGKEIYEGDVISYKQHHFNMESVTAKIKQVKWNNDRWNIYETNAGESDIEVIGNIHENSELLKSKIMNPYKINFPEGTTAEIDHENKVVVFNPIEEKKEIKEETLPLSVEEIEGRKWLLDACGEIWESSDCTDRNQLSTKPRAEAFLALMQLVELRDAWNGEWRADWLLVRGQHKWCICFEDESPEIFEVIQFRYILHFKSKLLAERFLNQFKGLIEQAKELL